MTTSEIPQEVQDMLGNPDYAAFAPDLMDGLSKQGGDGEAPSLRGHHHDDGGIPADQDADSGVGGMGGVVYDPSPDDPHDAVLSSEQKKSAASALAALAEELYDFGVSKEGEPYALPKQGPRVVSMLRGGKASLRTQLAREFWRSEGRVAPQQALADAMLVCEGLALDAEPRVLHLRVAGDGVDESIWLDLGDDTGRAVHVTPRGWWLADEPPVLFKRTPLTAELPVPAKDGKLGDLWQFLNVTEADRPLVAACLVASFITGISHPVLGLFGEQGCAKTSAARILVSLTDPSPVPVRKAPRDAETWVTAAAGSWVVALDNLSGMPDWLSDSVCRAVTGDGDVRRMLFKDSDLVVFAYRRVVIVNGIDLGALRGDLIDRMLRINLDIIPDESRLKEKELWQRWEAAQAGILGGLLSLTADVLAVLPSVSLPGHPRLADFAEVVAACDQILGTEGLRRYSEGQREMSADALTADPFIAAVQAKLGCGTFEGTAKELHDLVTPDRPPKDWPRNGRMVTTLLKRRSPDMRRTGWRVESKLGHTSTLHWSVTPPGKRESVNHPSHPSGTSATPSDQRKRDGGNSEDDGGIAGGIPPSLHGNLPSLPSVSAGQDTAGGMGGTGGVVCTPSLLPMSAEGAEQNESCAYCFFPLRLHDRECAA